MMGGPSPRGSGLALLALPPQVNGPLSARTYSFLCPPAKGPALRPEPESPTHLIAHRSAMLEHRSGLARGCGVTWVPEVHGVVRHSIHDLRIGRPHRLHRDAAVEQLEKIMRPRERDPRLHQPRLEVLFNTLLAVETCRVSHEIFATAKNLRGDLEVALGLPDPFTRRRLRKAPSLSQQPRR
jgi:hypothetical protein